jgi:hypothetical protein
MNFDKLPSDIKRLIFDMNRETAKENIRKRNFEMLLLVLFIFVALGVLGRADLASVGVDACAALS